MSDLETLTGDRPKAEIFPAPPTTPKSFPCLESPRCARPPSCRPAIPQNFVFHFVLFPYPNGPQSQLFVGLPQNKFPKAQDRHPRRRRGVGMAAGTTLALGIFKRDSAFKILLHENRPGTSAANFMVPYSLAAARCRTGGLVREVRCEANITLPSPVPQIPPVPANGQHRYGLPKNPAPSAAALQSITSRHAQFMRQSIRIRWNHSTCPRLMLGS